MAKKVFGVDVLQTQLLLGLARSGPVETGDFLSKMKDVLYMFEVEVL